MAARGGTSTQVRRTAQTQELSFEHEVAQVAYELYQRRGGTHGDDRQDWFEAERIVRTRRRSQNGR